MDLVIMNRGHMTKTTPKLAPPVKLSRWFLPNFIPYIGQVGPVWVSPHHTSEMTFGLLRVIQRATGLHTRWIFGGIEFQTWNPPATKPRPYHWATAAPMRRAVVCPSLI
ncbi:hypothetical protein AVEN_262035-1 [Araneus ventricosus]|uniref:Uncharacterized protein n=1 Tax=Araneus ventricosus TaxID=182803 RepID=A0A4Y2PIL9_ARAVE|nr:hypothetical protein AVEN_262035-1 [Araneus ventricosus]